MSRPVQRAPARAIPPGLGPLQHRFWTLSVAVWHAFDRGDAAAAEAIIGELSRLAPGNASVAEYRKVAAIVGFDWEARREARTPGTRTPPDPGAVDLVAFHADLPPQPGKRRTDYLALLVHAFRAATARAPHARRILLTDEHTPVPEGLAAHVVERRPLDLSRLMYERMRVQLEHLEARAAPRCTILLDTDVVVNREPAGIFEEDFDVGLTYRMESKDAPFNGGVIFAGPGPAAAAFLRRALACYDALADHPVVGSFYPLPLRAWWGDQFALFAAAGQAAFATRATEGLSVDGVRLSFFPADLYNHALDPAALADPALEEKFFVHFKGARKVALAPYAARLLAT